VIDSSIPDLVPYLLGLGRYAYRDGAIERYDRLHEAARGLAALEDGEGVALRLAATLSAVDRVLAALLVAAVRECVDATNAPLGGDEAERGPLLADDLWPRLSDEAYFTVARAQGRLGDFLCFWDWFVIPAETGLADAAERHRLVGAYLRGLPEGDERAGVRLAVLSLFEASEEQAAVALAFCNNLRLLEGADDALHERAAERLLWAAESGELERYQNEYVDLAAQVMAALGRWGVDASLPFLQALLRHPPTSFSPLARAHLRRAVLQLESGLTALPGHAALDTPRERASLTRTDHGGDGVSKGLRAGVSAPALQALVLALSRMLYSMG